MTIALAGVICSAPGAIEPAQTLAAADDTINFDPGITRSDPPGTVATTPIDEIDERIDRAVASWYGPGMWGNRTACGHTLTTELRGVAHRTLPCGSAVVLRHGSVTATVAVVDRGPYVLTREFDLTYATKMSLGCPDLCQLSWVR